MPDESAYRNADETANQERQYRTFWLHQHPSRKRPPVLRRPIQRQPTTDPTIPQKDVITDSEGFGIGDS